MLVGLPPMAPSRPRTSAEARVSSSSSSRAVPDGRIWLFGHRHHHAAEGREAEGLAPEEKERGEVAEESDSGSAAVAEQEGHTEHWKRSAQLRMVILRVSPCLSLQNLDEAARQRLLGRIEQLKSTVSDRGQVDLEKKRVSRYKGVSRLPACR